MAAPTREYDCGMGLLHRDPRALIRIGMAFLALFFLLTFMARRMPGDAIDLFAGIAFGIGAALVFGGAWRKRQQST